MSSPIDASFDLMFGDEAFRERQQQREQESQRQKLQHGLVLEDLQHKASDAVTRLDRLGKTRRAQSVAARMDLGMQAGPDQFNTRLNQYEQTNDPTGQTPVGMSVDKKTERIQALRENDRMLDFFEQNPQAAILAGDDDTLFSTAVNGILDAADFVTDSAKAFWDTGSLDIDSNRHSLAAFELMQARGPLGDKSQIPALMAEEQRLFKILQANSPQEEIDLLSTDTFFGGLGQMAALYGQAGLEGLKLGAISIPVLATAGAGVGAVATGPAAPVGAAVGAASAVVTGVPIAISAGFWANLAKREAGARYAELVREGADPDDPSTTLNALTYSSISTLIEGVALKYTWKYFGKPLAGATSGAARKYLKIQTNAYFKTPGKAAFVQNYLKGLGISAFAEGTEEILQASVARAFGDLAGGEDVTVAEVLDNAFSAIPEGVVAAGSVVLGAGLFAPFANYRINKQVRAQEVEQEFFNNLEEIGEKSTMAKRSPQLLGEFVGTLTSDTDKSTIYIDPQALQEALGQEGINDAEAEKILPGVRRDIDSAIEAGQRVAVPSKTFANVFVNSNLMPRVRDHISTSQTGQTNAERKASQEASASDPQVQATAEEHSQFLAIQTQLDESARVVGERVQKQLVASGRRTEKAATQEAEVVALRARAFAAQISEKAGRTITPEEAFQLAPFAVLSKAQVEGLQNEQPVRLTDDQILEQPAVIAATLRTTDGREFDGPTHGAAFVAAEEAGVARDQIGEEGFFRTDDGRVLTREEAFQEFGGESADANAVSRLRGQADSLALRDEGQPFITREQRGEVLGQDGATAGQTRDRGLVDETLTDAAVATHNRSTTLEQSAFHGGPRDHTGFSTAHIGTGEGAQAFGWGLYFTSAREIAEFYRNELSQTLIAYEGKTYGSVDSQLLDHVVNIVHLSRRYAINLAQAKTRYATSAISRLGKAKEDLEAAIESGGELEQALAEVDISAANRALDAADRIDVNKISEPVGGQLFEVNIPEESELMDWDAPLSEQPAKVREAIESLGLVAEVDGWFAASKTIGDGTVPVQRRALRSGIAEVWEVGGGQWRATANGHVLGEFPSQIEAMRAVDAAHPGVGRTGAQIYEDLRREFDTPNNAGRTDRLASEALAAVGIKGHKYDSGQLSGGTSNATNFVIYDDAAIEIQRKFYQQNAARRGFIQLRENEAYIALLRAADTSTFQHELAHWYLNQMVVAEDLDLLSQQQRTDFDAILRWLEVGSVDDLDQPYADGRLAPNGQIDKPHERFARGYEQYLLDGNAPAPEFKGIFARYRQWIIQAYGGIRAAAQKLGVPLSPEITEVYDRLFLVDQVVEEVGGGFSKPLLAEVTPESLGYEGENDPAWRRYLRDWEQHQEAAFQQVYRKHVAEVRVRKRQQRVELREQFKREAQEDFKNDPGWQVIRFIKRGEWPDGTVVEGPIPGLDRRALREVFWGEADYVIDALLAIPSQGRGRKLVAGKTVEGLDPDWLAEVFEFNSVREMVDAMLQARTVEQLIQERVNQEIAEADTFSETAIEEEAHVAASNDREALYLAELRRLRSLASGELLGTARRATAVTGAPAASESQARLEETQRQLDEFDPNTATDQERADLVSQAAAARALTTAEGEARRAQAAAGKTIAAIEERLRAGLLRQRAKTLVQGVLAGQLSRERKGWQAQTIREGKKARKLLAKRDYLGAAQSVERQLLAHYAMVEANELEAAVEKGHRDVTRIKRAKNLAKLRGPGFDGAAQILRLLQRFDLRKGRAKADTEAGQLEAIQNRRVQAVLSKQAVAGEFESLLTFQEKALEQGKILDVPTFLSVNNERDAMHWKDMTAFDFVELVDTIRNIDKISRQEVNSILEGKKVATQEAVEAVVDRIFKVNKLRKKSRSHKDRPLSIESFKTSWRTFDSWLLKIEEFYDFIGGDDINNAVRQYIWEPVQRSSERYRDMQLQYMKPFNEVISSLDWGRMQTTHYVPELGEVNHLRHYEIFMMALHMGTESNRFRLYEGFKNHRERKWNESGIDAALKLLNDEEWGAVQSIWDALDSLKDLNFQNHFDITGKRPRELERLAFISPTGRAMQGGYMPAKYDGSLDKRQRKLQDKADVKGLYGYSYAKVDVEHGSTQGRLDNYSAPLDLNPNVIPNHLDEVLYDIAFRQTVIDVHAVVNNAAVQNAISDTWGPEYVDTVDFWLREIARQGQDNTGRSKAWRNAEKLSNWARKGIVVSGLGYRISTGFLQITGWLPILAEVGTRDTLVATSKVMSVGIWPAIRATRQESSELRNRGITKDRELRELLGSLKGNNSFAAKAQANLGVFIVIGDAVVSTIAYEAQYQKSIRIHGNEKRARSEADRAIRRTQGAQDVKDLSDLMRAKGVYRWLTLFGSFASNLYGRQRRSMRLILGNQATVDDAQGNPVSGRLQDRATGVYMLLASIYLPAVAEAYLRGQGPDEEDELLEDPLRWMMWSLKNTVSFAVMPIPVLSDAVDKMLFPEHNFGGSSPTSRLFEVPVKLGREAYEGISEDEDFSVEALTRSVLTGVTLFGHIPLSQPEIWVDNFWEDQELESPRDLIWRKPKERR